jgi:hypothetical protein
VSRLVARWMSLVLAAVLLGGCGVSQQDVAEPLPSGALRSSTPAPSDSAVTRQTSICFVSGRNLEPVAEPITDHSAEGVMLALAAGPPPDRRGDLRTLLLEPLSGVPVLSVARVTTSGDVVVRHTDAFLQLSATDQVLLVGQVACSMAAVGLDRVLLVNPNNQPVPVALPDGRVREGTVTADDYRTLIVQGEPD